MTKVINLFGGPGTGKSTLAAALFASMKQEGLNVELVREYVKGWAWLDRKPTAGDQLYLLGKQTQAEYKLYGKVDYIITDSPFLLSPMYEQHYFNRDTTKDAALKFKALAEESGVKYYNFLLSREKEYNPKGRYETEDQAKLVDQMIETNLKTFNLKFSYLLGDDELRVNILLREFLYEKESL